MDKNNQKIIANFISMIAICAVWGFMSSKIFPFPWSLLFSCLGGGTIGYIFRIIIQSHE